ncbi:hypothetical protein DFJ73DRAFT_967122 [Zopfochytrium polystomum]|nr:hypothetical protein DFJ73DRAFT_967122 [Zopfochytrium polystomum]
MEPIILNDVSAESTMSWKNKVVPVQIVPTKPGRLRELCREHKWKKKETSRRKQDESEIESTMSWKNKFRMFRQSQAVRESCAETTSGRKRKHPEENKMSQKLVVPVQNVPTKPGSLRELCREHKWEKKETSRRKQDESEIESTMSWKNKVVPVQNVPTKPGRLRELCREHKWKKKETSRRKQDESEIESTMSWKNKFRMFRQSQAVRESCAETTSGKKRKHQEENKMSQKLVVPVQNVPTKPGRLRELCREHKWKKKETSRRKQDESEIGCSSSECSDKARPLERVVQRPQVEKKGNIKKKTR